jgi:hypothetical protein
MVRRGRVVRVVALPERLAKTSPDCSLVQVTIGKRAIVCEAGPSLDGKAINTGGKSSLLRCIGNTCLACARSLHERALFVFAKLLWPNRVDNGSEFRSPLEDEGHPLSRPELLTMPRRRGILIR